MPGNFLVEAYPVIIQPLDILVTAVSVGLVGRIIALIPARRIGREYPPAQRTVSRISLYSNVLEPTGRRSSICRSIESLKV